MIPVDGKSTYSEAAEALRSRLNPCNRVLATQDFRHACQRASESVHDYVRRLERMFQVAYGRDGMRTETREALLFSQLQEGLKYELVRSPTVSGAQTYQQLVLCAKNEEKRLAGLKQRQSYQKTDQDRSQPGSASNKPSGSTPQNPSQQGSRISRGHRCYNCNKLGHIAAQCTSKKKESNSETDAWWTDLWWTV